MRNLSKRDRLDKAAADEGLDLAVVALDVGDDESIAAADSPYKASYDKVLAYYEHSVASGADASIVADAIVAAATDHDHWAVHRPVGNDAEMLIQAAASMAPTSGSPR
jgi:hypothetical protein